MPPEAIRLRAEDPHGDAVGRLGAARADAEDAERLRAAATGTCYARYASARMSSAHANVAALEEWAHWIDHHTSLHPEADGDWGPRGPDGSDTALAHPHPHFCCCGHVLLVVGSGRHRLFFDPGETPRRDPVMDGACPACGKRLTDERAG